MRVTNSMLVSNLMRNLNSNLVRMEKLQNQMATGRKFAHISDDPTSLIYGQAARNKIARLENYARTVETAQNWLTQAEDGVMELQITLVHAYELTVDAASDAKGTGDAADKRNIAPMIGQLREHFLDTLNMTFGDKFVFGGYNTPGDPTLHTTDRGVKAFTSEGVPPQLYYNGFNLSRFDGMDAHRYDALFGFDINLTNISDAGARSALLARLGFADEAAYNAVHNNPAVANSITLDEAVTMHRLKNDVPTFDVGVGIHMPVTKNGIELVMFMTPDADGNMIMRNSWNVLQELFELTDAGAPATDIGKMIKPLQDAQNHLLTHTSDIGGRVRRLDLLEARYEQDYINYERMRSDAEDVDMAEVLVHMKMAEAVYQAALSAGARVIQPTLMDFLR